ncbi:histone-lysine N-methyltransferase EHMT1-like [Tiliqua scincoides]|uniref:histone-lysine N-methyltransferase EHMT1-like n=1 Tax=Tiliqua scincoides TaxID=71010 RepID=UPI003462915D
MGLSGSRAAGLEGPRSKDKKQPLHVLARKGHYDAALALLSQRTPKGVNKQDSGGRTPLFWATEYRHVDLVELLLTHGADVAARDHEGNTCLHWAASVGSAPITRRLLEAGAEVDARNERGDSPLHLAARERRYQCLVLLLAHGANVSLANRAGQTPLQCARHNSPPWSAMKAFISLPPGPVERTLSRDISRGFERVPIPCLNGVDSEPCPSNFLYITQDILSDSMALTTTDWIRRQDGQLVPTSSSGTEMGHIYECQVLCSCSSFCPNRVVQRGIRTQLQLYRTPDKGWGVRTVQDLSEGTFICQYFGEFISATELRQREDDTYHYRVDSKDGEEYYLDGNFYGNVGRFLNHSCEPNLVPVRVTVSHEIPSIAFFTSQAIEAGKELGFDYGDQYWQVKGLNGCLCKSPSCRFQPLPSLPAAGEPGPAPQCPPRGFAFKSKRRSPLRTAKRSPSTNTASLP